MTSFKSGSGDLDFGSAADDNSGEVGDTSSGAEAVEDDAQSDSPGDDTSKEKSETESTAAEYPYFVRRSNVTDERDQRIELHLRPEISEKEAAFRNELATALETDTVPKTDAREFALKFAFQHPEQVAELMLDEGFGVLD